MGQDGYCGRCPSPDIDDGIIMATWRCPVCRNLWAIYPFDRDGYEWLPISELVDTREPRHRP